MANSKRKRLIFISSIFAISIAALVFVIMNFRDNIIFFYSPSELQSSDVVKKIAGQSFRIGGLVEEGSVKKIDALMVEFVVTDLKQEVTVIYKGVLPDLFRDGQGVVAKGKWDAEKKQFFTSELLVKHDEKYMPPEVAKSIKHE